MSRLTAQVVVEVNTKVPLVVQGEIQRDAVPEQQAVQLLKQLVTLLLRRIVQRDVKGEIGFLYSPGLGVDIDMRKYDTSALPGTRQKRLRKELQLLEGTPVHIHDSSDLQVAIKIDLTIT